MHVTVFGTTSPLPNGPLPRTPIPEGFPHLHCGRAINQQTQWSCASHEPRNVDKRGAKGCFHNPLCSIAGEAQNASILNGRSEESENFSREHGMKPLLSTAHRQRAGWHVNEQLHLLLFHSGSGLVFAVSSFLLGRPGLSMAVWIYSGTTSFILQCLLGIIAYSCTNRGLPPMTSPVILTS
jgi:hypothetical protein